ncbi:hypothetical protein ABZ260_26055 [Streptosporangium sp. NPDC006013]
MLTARIRNRFAPWYEERIRVECSPMMVTVRVMAGRALPESR